MSVLKQLRRHGDQTTAAQRPRWTRRFAKLRPGKRPGCVQKVEDSVRAHRDELGGLLGTLGLKDNASAEVIADAVVAAVEDGLDFAKLPKAIHDDVVHAYMAAKLGARR